LGALTFEIGTGLGTGLVLGKIATLGRGAVLKALPQGLVESNRFKNLITGLDIAILGTLTTAEAVSISKTYQKEGEEAALLQLIGDLSFVKGFAKTGLRTDAQSQREFTELANKFKSLFLFLQFLQGFVLIVKYLIFLWLNLALM